MLSRLIVGRPWVAAGRWRGSAFGRRTIGLTIFFPVNMRHADWLLTFVFLCTTWQLEKHVSLQTEGLARAVFNGAAYILVEQIDQVVVVDFTKSVA